MDDIREIERQTQLALQMKMGNDNSSCGAEEGWFSFCFDKSLFSNYTILFFFSDICISKFYKIDSIIF